MLLGAVLLLGLAASGPRVLVAQSSEEEDGPVRVGDLWVYDTKDELTGFPKGTYSEIVTEISAKEIVTNVTFSGKALSTLLIYGPAWNRIDAAVWKFKPSDGQGISLPLAVGKSWRAEFDSKNTQTGITLRGSSLSKVVAREMLTTGAGTFETFKIERQIRQFNTANPAGHSESQIVVWYAPQINHWVRRTFLTKSDRRTRSSTSEELTDFTRKL